MSRENELTPFEHDLAGLRPTPARCDRDQLMFQAGQAAVGRPRRTPWLLSASAGALVGAAAAVVLFPGLRPEPQVVERIVYLTVPAASVAEAPTAENAAAVAEPQPVAPQPAVRTAHADRPNAEPTFPAGAIDPSMNYAALRARVLADGLPALERRAVRQRPSAGSSRQDASRYGPPLNSLLGELASPQLGLPSPLAGEGLGVRGGVEVLPHPLGTPHPARFARRPLPQEERDGTSAQYDRRA